MTLNVSKPKGACYELNESYGDENCGEAEENVNDRDSTMFPGDRHLSWALDWGKALLQVRHGAEIRL